MSKYPFAVVTWYGLNCQTSVYSYEHLMKLTCMAKSPYDIEYIDDIGAPLDWHDKS